MKKSTFLEIALFSKSITMSVGSNRGLKSRNTQNDGIALDFFF